MFKIENFLWSPFIFILTIFFSTASFALGNQKIDFFNYTDKPIDIVYSKKQCIDDAIWHEGATLPAADTRILNYTKDSINVKFENNILGHMHHHYDCLNIPKWVRWRVVSRDDYLGLKVLGYIKYGAYRGTHGKGVFTFQLNSNTVKATLFRCKDVDDSDALHCIRLEPKR